MSMLLTALALAIAPQPITHTVTVDHQNTPIAATYRADIDVRTRQIGLSAGTRPSTARCVWTARVGVVRDLTPENGAPISRRLDEDKQFEGSRAGSCAATARQVETDLRATTPAVQAHVVQAAARDEQALRAELRSMSQLALN
jgi:hypothetical protein